MELIEGGTLRDHRPDDITSVIAITRQVCAALEHAHAQGIIHRDLKPDNVMLTADGSVKLMDFGLARSTTGPQLTQEGVIIGTLRYLAPELILGEAATPQSDLYSLGAMLYEIVAGQPLFGSNNINEIVAQHLHAPVIPPSTHNPAIPPELDGLIVRLLAKRPAERPASALEVRQILDEIGSVEAPMPGESPFKGLQYFEEADASLFFGREALTERLVAHIQDMAVTQPTSPALLTVVGASGSGKSSLVRAGLLAHMRQAQPAWPVYVLTPTAHPLETLAASLTRHIESVTAAATLMDDLQRDPRSLLLFIRRAIHIPEGARLLLVVDQFEEIFTLCHDEAERTAFLDNLLTALADERVVAVLALRADFYAHCAQYPRLRHALCVCQEYIGPMSAAEIRRAIERPALQATWEFESGLVELILRDTGANDERPPEPGALPLLSHALLETWQHRSGRRLTLRGYHEAGGVHGAIAKTAESVFAALSPEQQTLARRIFLRLTELGEGTQDTRRRAPLSELTPHTDDGWRVQELLKTLADARLLTLSEGTAEVAHEALIREWPTLHDWLNEDRRYLRIQRHLTESAQAWDARGREPGDLYRGSRLATAIEWSLVADHADEMSHVETAFLQASQEYANREALEREQQLQRELIAAQKLAEASKISYARELEMAAAANLDKDANLTLLLAMEAISVSRSVGYTDTWKAQQLIHDAFQKSRLTLTYQHQEAIQHIAFGSEGKWIALAGDQFVSVINAASGELAMQIPGSSGIEFSPNGRYLAVANPSGEIGIWDVSRLGEANFTPVSVLTLTLSDVERNHPSWYLIPLIFSADGKWLAANLRDQIISIWDVSALTQDDFQPSGSPKLPVYSWKTSDDGHVYHLSFTPDGAFLTGETWKGLAPEPKVVVWHSSDGEEFRVFPGGQCGEFSPDGNYLAVCDRKNLVNLYDLTSGQKEPLKYFSTNGTPYCVAFSSDGSRLLVGEGVHFLASSSGSAYVFDVSTGARLLKFVGEGPLASVAFSPDGIHVASAGAMLLKIYNTSRWFDEQPPFVTGYFISGIAFSRGGNRFSYYDEFTHRIYAYDYSDRGYTLLHSFVPAYTDDEWDRDHALSPNDIHGFIALSAINPTQNFLATVAGGEKGSSGNTVVVWDLMTEARLFTLKHDARVGCLLYSPDGQNLVVGSGNTIYRYDSVTGALLDTIQTRFDPLRFCGCAFAFTPDGKRLALLNSTTTSSDVLIWSLGSDQPPLAIKTDQALSTLILFSHDGKRLATGGQTLAYVADTTVKIWNAQDGSLIYCLDTESPMISTLDFNPDDRYLIATSMLDGYSQVWDTDLGVKRLTIRTFRPYFWGGGGFTPNGKYIDLLEWNPIDWQYIFRRFVFDVDELMVIARTRLTRGWTPEECRQYLHTDTCPPDPR
jgi:WD40 repeat protein